MSPEAPRTRQARDVRWSTVFGAVLVARLLYPFFDSPLTHLFSDPQRHWDNGGRFLHPNVIGGGDPLMYQLWVFLLRELAGANTATILTGCGLLCAAMPYGWYRALRELLPRGHALKAAVLIGLWPSWLGIYGYFMTETLLLTLTGFAFALTLRAARKRTVMAFALACALWLVAGLTRIVILPIAALSLLWVWLPQPQKLPKALLALCLGAAMLTASGLHARLGLRYFAPLGNLYLNEIYRDGLRKNIQLDFGREGVYGFGSPSYYNPTFYPFSDWTTAREGTYLVRIDTSAGRGDWIRELARARAQSAAPQWRDVEENLCYLFFGISWPDDDRSTVIGNLTFWSRWLFVPSVLWTLIAVARRSYRERAWLLPSCALLSLLLMTIQREGIMEGRYRKPLEPLFLVAIALSWRARAAGGAAA